MVPVGVREIAISEAMSQAVSDSGLTQKEFAARCGISLGRLHSIVHSGVHVRASDVAAVCDAFGYDANEMLGVGDVPEYAVTRRGSSRLDDAALDYLAEEGPSTSAPMLMRGLQKMGYDVKLPDVVRALASMGIRAASETRPKHSTRRNYIRL